jgi:uncharacterized protein YigE (DUF2233 family)
MSDIDATTEKLKTIAEERVLPYVKEDKNMEAVALTETKKFRYNRVFRVDPPWQTIDLSKKERKGKTFEELQEMRKKVWEERQKA